MQLSVDVSMYPLKDEFIPAIHSFISRVESIAELTVVRNAMSTQLFGDYDLVMDTLRDEMRLSYEQFGKAIFVCKFVNGNLNE